MGGPTNLIGNAIFNVLYNRNPQFRELADSVRGMTPEQAFQERGLDYSQYQNMSLTNIRQMLGL